MYDIIGDVHGHAQLLKKMLHKLGYVKTASGYACPGRQAIFVGDFVNRGPEIKKTIRLIRNMVESGNAMAILGNHEVNLIVDHLKNKSNPFQKSEISLLKTINEFRDNQVEWKENIKWLRTLPFFIEPEGLRIVHACWSDESVEYLKKSLPPGKLKKEFFRKIRKEPESPLSKHISLLTRGIQFIMPGDLKIINNKGVSPRSFRTRWWENPTDKTFGEISFDSKFQLPDYTIPPQILPESMYYPENSPPVFFGHYCRREGPHIIKHNLCCIDACIAGSKMLLAYRWDGESILSEEKMVRVSNQI